MAIRSLRKRAHKKKRTIRNRVHNKNGTSRHRTSKHKKLTRKYRGGVTTRKRLTDAAIKLSKYIRNNATTCGEHSTGTGLGWVIKGFKDRIGLSKNAQMERVDQAIAKIKETKTKFNEKYLKNLNDITDNLKENINEMAKSVAKWQCRIDNIHKNTENTKELQNAKSEMKTLKEHVEQKTTILIQLQGAIETLKTHENPVVINMIDELGEDISPPTE